MPTSPVPSSSSDVGSGTGTPVGSKVVSPPATGSFPPPGTFTSKYRFSKSPSEGGTGLGGGVEWKTVSSQSTKRSVSSAE